MSRKRTTWALLMCLFIAGGCTSLPSNTNKPVRHTIDLLTNANEAYIQGDWRAAEQHYRQLIEFMDRDSFSHFRLANVLLRLNRVEEATMEFKTALRLNPNFPEARHNLALSYILLAKNSLERIKPTSQEQETLLMQRQKWLEQAATAGL